MRLLTALAGAAGGLGALAGINRHLVADELDPPLGREQSTHRWRGFDIAYTTAGDPDDRDLLLLHGVNVAGSSHEFRHIVDDLAATYHVLAPDLPGFGRSDRPPVQYTASLYAAFLRDFAADLTQDAVCVAASLSGAYAAMAAPDTDVAELVLVCPTASTVAARRPWLRSLYRSPVVGQGLHNLITARPAIRYFLAHHAVADPAHVTDEWVAYDWATTHQPGARFAPASFLSGHLEPDLDLGGELADLAVPVTLLWGAAAGLAPIADGRALAERADVRLLSLAGAGMLPHVEYPGTVVDILAGAEGPV